MRDEDEFELNRVAMTYPDDVITRALGARDEVLHLAEANVFPFDDMPIYGTWVLPIQRLLEQ